MLSMAMSCDGCIDGVSEARLLPLSMLDFDRVGEARAGCDAIMSYASTLGGTTATSGQFGGPPALSRSRPAGRLPVEHGGHRLRRRWTRRRGSSTPTETTWSTMRRRPLRLRPWRLSFAERADVIDAGDVISASS